MQYKKKHIIGSIMILLIALMLQACQTGPSESTDPSGNGQSDYSYEAPQAQGDTYWWHENVFYEVFVRSFYDSDGDGTGDIRGLIEKLDYLNDGNPETDSDLGITGIWLMPIFQSPSYHGYDVSDYRQINRDYGKLSDFSQLIRETKKRGIKLIVDMVINHSSIQHPWFSERPEWYRWSVFKPANSGPWGQEVWHRHQNGSYYYGLFWEGMPDLNYRQEGLYHEILDICRYWLSDIGVDGFRLDAVKYIYESENKLENLDETFAFWRDFQKDIVNIKSDAVNIGEAWDETEVVSEYVNRANLDLCFEFDLATTLINDIINDSPTQTVAKMKTIKGKYRYHSYSTFLTNHDQDRVASRFNDRISDLKLAAAVYLSLPGVPVIYYGEEIAMRGTGDHLNVRRPMQWNDLDHAGFSTTKPWNDIDSHYRSANVQIMQTNPDSLWHRYRKWIDLRQNYTALSRGTYQAIRSTNGVVYAFLRQYGDQAVCALHNFSSYQLTDLRFDIDRSNIPGGDYRIIDLMSKQYLSDIHVDENGGFSNWNPINMIEAKDSRLLLFEKKINSSGLSK